MNMGRCLTPNQVTGPSGSGFTYFDWQASPWCLPFVVFYIPFHLRALNWKCRGLNLDTSTCEPCALPCLGPPFLAPMNKSSPLSGRTIILCTVLCLGNLAAACFWQSHECWLLLFFLRYVVGGNGSCVTLVQGHVVELVADLGTDPTTPAPKMQELRFCYCALNENVFQRVLSFACQNCV